MSSKVNLKVILLGDSNVGKTSLITQYVQKNFNNNLKSTIGADLLTQRERINDKIVNLHIWDTAGMEKFSPINSNFYRFTNCVVLVFDVTNAESFVSLETWYTEFKKYVSFEDADLETFPLVVIGNKIDEKTKRKVSVRDALKWCREKRTDSYFESSAKDNINVQEAFRAVARKALNNKELLESQTIELVDWERIAKLEIGTKNLERSHSKKKCC